MLEPDVTYEDMTRLFGDAVREADFDSCLPHARALVRDVTFPNQPLTAGQREAWVAAVCAVVAEDAAVGCSHGYGLGGGFTIGKFSMGGASSGGSADARADMRDAALLRLVGSGLLYRGMGSL
jgi:uncharacterized membrane protein YgcG